MSAPLANALKLKRCVECILFFMLFSLQDFSKYIVIMVLI
jgi:hypothetical protein